MNSVAQGEMSELVRAKDWAGTPLGDPQSWSPGLKLTVAIMLSSGFPMALRWGPDFVLIYNDAYRPILGDKHPRVLGLPFREAWPEVEPQLGPVHRALLAGEMGATFSEDLPLRVQRHGTDWEDARFTVSYSPVPDQSAPTGVGGVLVTAMETTNRVRAERALAESEERYRLAVTAFQGATYETDLETGFAYRAPGVYAMLGVDPEQAEPTRDWWFRRIHPEDAPRFFRALEDLFSGAAAELNIEFRLRHEAGGWVWVWQRGLAVRDSEGSLKKTVGALLDVTDRKRAEAALLESEARFRHMADSAPALIWMTDTEGKLTFANMHFGYVFGRSTSEILRQGWRTLLHPDHLAKFTAEFREVFNARASYRTEFLCADRYGQDYWVKCECVPRLDDAGTFLGYTGCGINVSDVKAAQAHERLLVNELNHRVKNSLATVQSLVSQTFRHSQTIDDARSSLNSRISALARAHDLLTDVQWQHSDLHELVRRALQAHSEGEFRFVFDGPPISLPPRTSLSLAMALHELLTNALKYGALSNETGSVAVTWQVDAAPHAPLLTMRWEEKNGPTVKPPSRTGFGTRLLKQGLAAELRGEVSLDYRAGGVICTIRTPLPDGKAHRDGA